MAAITLSASVRAARNAFVDQDGERVRTLVGLTAAFGLAAAASSFGGGIAALSALSAALVALAQQTLP